MVTCQNCKKEFEITAKDRELLDMLKVPDPTFCPQCRFVRRNVFRNERSLYKRACDSCKKESIMMYPAQTPFPVYCKPCWWSDSWSAKTFGRDYDFSKPFFRQMLELRNAVPRPGVIHQGFSINSEYTNRVWDMRNCYLVFGASNVEHSRYSVGINGTKESQDCFATIKSEKCYECIDSSSCYELAFSRECTNCRSSWFLQNCVNCSDCFGCVNLRNKQYCIFNEQYTKEEYEKKIAGFNLKSADAVAQMADTFLEFKKQFIVPALVTRRSVMASGNWMEDCKNVTDSFTCQSVEDGRHCYSVFNAKAVMDYSQWGAGSEYIYETVNAGIGLGHVYFGNECWTELMESQYVMNCHSSKNLFGCIGIRNGEYCIFNKEYSKEEYEKLRAQIIEHMNTMPYVDAGGRQYRYGEFYPIELSPHHYNETSSQEFFPISKEEAQKQKFPWKDPEPRNYKIGGDIIGCAHKGECNDQCTTAFRMIPEEIEMYQRRDLPPPTLCPNCRHYARIKARNPLRLWPRSCQCQGTQAEGGEYKNLTAHSHGESPCPNTFDTSYAPDRPEKVYCIECYQQEVA